MFLICSTLNFVDGCLIDVGSPITLLVIDPSKRDSVLAEVFATWGSLNISLIDGAVNLDVEIQNFVVSMGLLTSRITTSGVGGLPLDEIFDDGS